MRDEVTRWDAKTREARSVSPWLHTLDAAPNEVKYRCHWTPPLAIDPFDHNTVYYGCQVIFKTSDGGQSWTVISPDLSTQDPEHIHVVGWHRRRQPGAILRGSCVRHRALDGAEGPAVGRHQRRQSVVHARRRVSIGTT